MHLTLLIPELIWPEPRDQESLGGLDCPALATLLARGRFARQPVQAMESLLATESSFSFADGPPPYAALRLAGERGSSHAESARLCYCADPVHLRFHDDHLLLADSSRFTISMDEAQALESELNRRLSGFGRFHVATPDRWYFFPDEELDGEAAALPPLSTVSGRRIEHLLPAAGKAKALHRLLNETQMALHQHPLNQARENAGLLPVNSVWFWGRGRYRLVNGSATGEAGQRNIWSNDPLACGLARAVSAAAHELPGDARSLLRESAKAASGLIVLDPLSTPVQYELSAAYRAALEDLEQNWFSPLCAALSSGRIREFKLSSTTVYGTLHWTLKRPDLYKFWRTEKPLAEIAATLAKAHR
jgi:hypothetical protein